VVTFRPALEGIVNVDRQRGIRAMIIVGQIAVLLVILTRLVTGSWALPLGVLILAIIAAATIIYIWLYRKNSSVELTASHVLLSDWSGSVRAVPRSDVARFVRIGAVGFEGPARPMVVATDSAGHALFTFGGAYDEMAMARALSVPVTGSFDDHIRVGEIRRKYPGAAHGVDLASRQTLALVAIATFVVGVVGFLVWAAVH
jgi:hypothetical protein